ncbi:MULTISPECIES: hypothetical protein [unclassified Pseudofrankia]|uniref:hypothetical protein n=1 Tax=unclassified Pseudofrankia TaxID=2994372 RepID=UPI001F521771|nr:MULTISPECIES: hypothetical protein [unclassified Pseudofrankia]MDT3440938.1 hypothetical protein [Pseudofrankia sp. BMG5.37]
MVVVLELTSPVAFGHAASAPVVEVAAADAAGAGGLVVPTVVVAAGVVLTGVEDALVVAVVPGDVPDGPVGGATTVPPPVPVVGVTG